MDVDFNNYPHYSKFLVDLAVNAKQKKQDRELVEQFGIVDDDENEEEAIWRMEQAMMRSR